MQREKSREFNRQSIPLLAAITLALFFCVQPMLSVMAGLLLPRMATEFGWNPVMLPFAVSLSFLLLMIGTPLAGFMIRRFGSRPVVIVSALAYPATIAAFAMLAGGSASLFGLIAVFGLVGAGTGSVPLLTILPFWFDRRLGAALSIAIAGIGIGQAALPVAVGALVNLGGWRSAFLALAGANLIGVVPALWLFYRAPAIAGGASVGAAGVEHLEGAVLGDAVRTSSFWTMLIAFLLVSTVASACIIHLVQIVTDRGYSIEAAARLLSLPGIAILAVRPIAGVALDRLGGRPVAAVSFAVALVGTLLLAQAGSLAQLAVGAFLVGVGVGIEGDVMAFCARSAFGRRDYAAILSLFGFAFASGPLVGPPLLGLARWYAGGYALGLEFFAGLIGLSIVLILVTGASAQRRGAS